jgi:hypothetical protein
MPKKNITEELEELRLKNEEKLKQSTPKRSSKSKLKQLVDEELEKSKKTAPSKATVKGTAEVAKPVIPETTRPSTKNGVLNVAQTTPKLSAEDIVKAQSIPGKTAEGSARVLDKLLPPESKSAKDAAEVFIKNLRDKSPAERSAEVFEEFSPKQFREAASSATSKSAAEDIVKAQAIRGKTAKDAAKVFEQGVLPKSAKEAAQVFEDAGSAMSKNVAEDIVKGQSLPGKTAAQAAEVFEESILPKSAKESAKVFEEAGSVLPKGVVDRDIAKQSLSGKTAKDAAEVLAGSTKESVEDFVKSQSRAGNTAKESAKVLDKLLPPENKSAKESAKVFEELSKKSPLLSKLSGPALAKVAAGLGIALEGYDVYKNLKSGDYREAAGSAGSSLGALGGSVLGSGVATIPLAIGGSMAGERAAKGLYDLVAGSEEDNQPILSQASKKPQTPLKTPYDVLTNKQDVDQSEGFKYTDDSVFTPPEEGEVVDLKGSIAESDEIKEYPADADDASAGLPVDEDEEEFDTPLETKTAAVEEDVIPSVDLTPEAVLADIEKQEKPVEEAEEVEETPTIATAAKKPEQKSRLEQALQDQRNLQLLALLSRSTERLGRGIGGAIAGTAPSAMSGGEAEQLLLKMAESGTEEAKEYEKAQEKKEKKEKEERESDPNSKESKAVQQKLVDLSGGKLTLEQVANVTAKSFKDDSTLMYRILGLASREGMQQKAIEAKSALEERKILGRKELAEITAKAREKLLIESKQLTKGADLAKYIERQNDKSFKSDVFKVLRSTNDSIGELEENIKRASPSGVKDIAIMYNFIKKLDPESTVRASELELMRESFSVWEKLSLTAEKIKANPQLLTPRVKKEMLDLAKELQKRTLEDYNKIIEAKTKVAVQFYNAKYDDAFKLLDVLDMGTPTKTFISSPTSSVTPTPAPSAAPSPTPTATPSGVTETKSGLRLYKAQ